LAYALVASTKVDRISGVKRSLKKSMGRAQPSIYLSGAGVSTPRDGSEITERNRRGSLSPLARGPIRNLHLDPCCSRCIGTLVLALRSFRIVLRRLSIVILFTRVIVDNAGSSSGNWSDDWSNRCCC
jgi:hypothetical protein